MGVWRALIAVQQERHRAVAVVARQTILAHMAQSISTCITTFASPTMTDKRDGGARLKDVLCPQCKKPFKLTWNDYGDEPCTLVVRDCPSGGVYDVFIECPHCHYKEDL